MKQIIRVVLALALLLALAVSASAVSTTDSVEKVALDTPCAFHVTYEAGGTPFSGLEIRIYRVAELSEEEQYALCGSFAGYPVELTGTTDQNAWDALTLTLNSYILADSVKPDAVQTTDGNGTASFSDLKAGIYLVGAVRTERDGTYYAFESFCAAVPTVTEEGKWSYDVSAYPKNMEERPTKGEVEYKVVKLWKDNGSAKRPSSVTVEIYRDSVLQETVLLSGDNDWTYRWKTLDDGSVWTAVERNTPAGYTVTLGKSGATFTLVNTRPGDTPKTGDGFTGWTVLALSGAALTALGVLLVKRKHEA